jgi:hypothetical protein
VAATLGRELTSLRVRDVGERVGVEHEEVGALVEATIACAGVIPHATIVCSSYYSAHPCQAPGMPVSPPRTMVMPAAFDAEVDDRRAAAVADDHPDLGVRPRDLRTDRCRQGKAHGAESAGRDERARRVVVVVLRF